MIAPSASWWRPPAGPAGSRTHWRCLRVDNGGGCLTAALAATASETKPSKRAINSNLIEICLMLLSMLCLHFFTLKALWVVSSWLSISLHHFLQLSFLHPPISLPFLTLCQYLLFINIHGAKASLFLCGALKVILLKALLSVPATACELKVLICIHKITHESRSSNC